MKKAILFDLDGTLLPLDMDIFIKKYYELIKKSMVLEEAGIDIKTFNDAVWHMFKERHPDKTNEQAFNDKLEELAQVKRDIFEPVFDSFYERYYDEVKQVTRKEDICREAVDIAKSKNYKLILATNPVFPKNVTIKRINWAGFSPEEFDYISYIDNTHFSKPDLDYYSEILDKNNLLPKECIMIGNSTKEDMCAAKLGMDVFIITEHLVGNKEEVAECPSGGYLDFLNYIKDLPQI
ncbi:MAG: HAD family hydrolase [Eubacteriales bacterium]